MKEAMLHRATELFAQNVPYSVLGQPKAFNCANPPPQVKILTVVPGAIYPVSALRSKLIHLWKVPFAGTGGVLLGHAEERLARGSGHHAIHSAGGKRRQHVI